MYARNILKLIATASLTLSTIAGMHQSAIAVESPTEAPVNGVSTLIDPALQPLLGNLPPQLKLITRDSLEEVRTLVGKMLRASPLNGVSVTRATVQTTETDVPVYIYRPEAQPANDADKTQRVKRPALLWIHGGGFIMGSAQSDFAARFAKSLNITVVSVDYRLAPEHPFPAGLNDSYAALQWVVAQADELGIDPERIAVGGDSAGAGLAAGLVLHTRDQKGPAIAFQFLLYPMLDNLHATPSGSIEDYPVWSRQTSFNAWEMYLNGTPGANASPYAAPARATNVGNLPPTFITTGTVDLFRDEIIDYAQRLMAADVPTQLAVFPGVFHGAQIFAPDAAVSRRMINSYVSAMKEALAPQLGTNTE